MAELTRASQVLLPIPNWMFVERPHVANKDPFQVTWVCDVHGVIAPRECANGWTRRTCPCEIAAREAQQHGMLMQVSKATTAKQKADKTYTWLGPDATEIGLESKAFTNFDPTKQPKVAEFRTHLATARMYASQLVNCHTVQRVQLDNMLMKGPCGTGKTHLAASILNELRARGIGCLFCTANNLFNTFYAVDLDEKQKLIAQLVSTPLACIDELDGLYLSKNTEGLYQQLTLTDILSRRYQRQLPTMIITNVENDLSPWLEKKVVSRLFEHMTVLKMIGVDYRLAKPEKARGN